MFVIHVARGPVVKIVKKTDILAGAGIPCSITHMNASEDSHAGKHGCFWRRMDLCYQCRLSPARNRMNKDLGTVDSAIENGYHVFNETDNHYQ